MTLESPSRGRQWIVWAAAAVFLTAVYALVSLFVFGSVSFDLTDPLRYRLALPFALFYGIVAWETRWDGIVRVASVEKGPPVVEKSEPETVRTETPSSPERPARPLPVVELPPEPEMRTPEFEGDGFPETDGLDGEALYALARTMPHQPVPDFELDSDYLELLSKSAEAGYPFAMAKLGEYAMRRAAWVEAYYWMYRAKRCGLGNLSDALSSIVECWTAAGRPDEVENVHGLFSLDDGSVARALLDIALGVNVDEARQFLSSARPELS